MTFRRAICLSPRHADCLGGKLAGALVVRENQELVFISQNGMVQRTSVRGINRYGRASQGVRVMNLRDDDQVSAVALVVESEASTAAKVVGDDEPAEDGVVADGGGVAENGGGTDGGGPDGAADGEAPEN